MRSKHWIHEILNWRAVITNITRVSPTKLLEGKLFIGICLFIGSSVHRVRALPPRHVQTCSSRTSLYSKLPLLPPGQVQSCSRIVSKRAVGIQLQCLLVFVIFTGIKRIKYVYNRIVFTRHFLFQFSRIIKLQASSCHKTLIFSDLRSNRLDTS